jgi:hypothetical protein
MCSRFPHSEDYGGSAAPARWTVDLPIHCTLAGWRSHLAVTTHSGLSGLLPASSPPASSPRRHADQAARNYMRWSAIYGPERRRQAAALADFKLPSVSRNGLPYLPCYPARLSPGSRAILSKFVHDTRLSYPSKQTFTRCFQLRLSMALTLVGASSGFVAPPCLLIDAAACLPFGDKR